MLVIFLNGFISFGVSLENNHDDRSNICVLITVVIQLYRQVMIMGNSKPLLFYGNDEPVTSKGNFKSFLLKGFANVCHLYLLQK